MATILASDAVIDRTFGLKRKKRRVGCQHLMQQHCLPEFGVKPVCLSYSFVGILMNDLELLSFRDLTVKPDHYLLCFWSL